MMDTSRDLTSKVEIDTTNFKARVSELQRQVKVIESGFKAAAAGMEDWSHTSEGLEAHIKALTGTIGLQQQKVDGLSRVYLELAAGGKTSQKELDLLQITINNETGKLNKMNLELTQSNTGLANLGNTSKNTGEKFNILKGSLTELNSAINIGREAVQIIGAAYKLLVGDTMEYLATVRTLSRETGQSAEETSRMIQMTDDLGLELKTLETAAKGAATKGIALTTEGLAKMSDEWNALGTVEEKNKYLLDHFGKSGLELGKIFEKSGDEIRQASQAVAENMIATKAQEDAGRNLEIALDNLNDAWTGIKYTVGNAVIPVLVDATGAFDTLSSGLQKINLLLRDHAKNTALVTGLTYEAYKAEVLRSYNMADVESNTNKLTNAGILYSQATWEAVRASDPLIDKFNALQLGASNLKQPIIDDTEALNALKASMSENIVTMDQLSASAIYNEMALGLDEQGALDLALQMGLLTPEVYNYRKQLDLLNQNLLEKKITVDQFIASVALLNENINGLHDVTYTITQIMRMVGASDVPSGPTNPVPSGPTNLHYNGETLGAPEGYQWWWKNGAWVTEKIPGRATGGDVTAGQTYWVGEDGPEPFIPSVPGNILSNDSISDLLNSIKQVASGLNIPIPTMSAPGAASGQQMPVTAPVTITVNATVANDMDTYVLARRIAQEIQRAR